jgi:hypothetical protein
VAATRFVSCNGPVSSPTFIAEVELVGGQSWRSGIANLQPDSGDWWRATYLTVNEGTQPVPFVWANVLLQSPSGEHQLEFPASMVIRVTCPT